MRVLLVDIGATNIRIGLGQRGKVQVIHSAETPAEWSIARDLITHHAAEHEVDALMVGLPGTLDGDRQSLVRAPNLGSWVGVSIAQELRKAAKIPVALENDALLNALGEATHGAGKRHQIVGFLTVSSGVNGARIVAGRPDPGAFSYELGLLPIHGVTIESIISGRALEQVHGTAPEQLPRTTWQAVERSLVTVLLQLMLIWRPEIMIISGPMIREKKVDMKRVMSLLAQRWQHPSPPADIVAGKLGDVSGLWGGLVYLDLHSEEIFGRV